MVELPFNGTFCFKDCNGDDFSCKTTKYCIPKSWICDGADDCKDNSDEIDCPKKPNVVSLEDNLVAQASEFSPGLLSIIAENTDEAGSNRIPLPSQQNDLANFKPENAEVSEFPSSDDKTPSEILAAFSGLGGDSRGEAQGDEPLFESPLDGEETSNQNEESSGPLTDENERKEGIRHRNVTYQHTPRRRPMRPGSSRPNRQRIEISPPAENPSSETLDAFAPISSSETKQEDKSEETMRVTTATPTRPTRRRRPDRTRLPSRRTDYQSIHPSAKETPEGDSSDLEETETNEDVPQDSETKQDLRGNSRINWRPTPSQFESFRTGVEVSTYAPPARRPVSIIRRRPISSSRTSPLSEKVKNFMKETKEEPEQAAETAVHVAQPITIPEQMVPSIPKEEAVSFSDELNTSPVDEVMGLSPNAEDSNVEGAPFQPNERPVTYLLADHYENPQKLFPLQQQFGFQAPKTQKPFANRFEYSEPQRETALHQQSEVDRVAPPRYEIPEQYQNDESANPHYEAPQQNAYVHPQYQPQQLPDYQNPQQNQPFGNYQDRFEPSGNYQIDQDPSASGAVAFYHRPQIPERSEPSQYSQQTFHQHPVYSENVYEYANPEFNFRRIAPIHRERYPAVTP